MIIYKFKNKKNIIDIYMFTNILTIIDWLSIVAVLFDRTFIASMEHVLYNINMYAL